MLLVLFVVVQAKISHPLVPLSLFGEKQFTGANLVTLAVYAALSGGLFLLPVELINVSGFSALAAGVALLPVTLVMLLLSARAGRLASRIGPRWLMTFGPILAGVGLGMFVLVGPHASYWSAVLPAVPGLLPRPVGHGRPADRHRPGRRPEPLGRHRLRGQQRRGPDRRTAGRGRAAGSGRHHPGGLRRSSLAHRRDSTGPS